MAAKSVTKLDGHGSVHRQDKFNLNYSGMGDSVGGEVSKNFGMPVLRCCVIFLLSLEGNAEIVSYIKQGSFSSAVPEFYCPFIITN